MGGSSKKTTETTNQVSNQTSRPIIGNANLSGGLNDYLKSLNDFQANTTGSSLVAGPSALQTQAFNGAANLGTSPLYGQAAGIAGNVAGAGANTAQGASLRDSLQSYLDSGSGYTTNVTNAYLNDFDQTAGQTRAAQAAQGAANGAFGGSRYGIQEAATEGELARARASGLAGILQQGYNTALGAAAQDASLAQNNSQFNAGQQDSALSRQLASAGLLGQLGSQQASDQRTNIGLQAALGDTQRGIEQGKATADLSLLQAMGQLYGYNPALFTGQQTNGTATSTGTSTTKENPGLLGSIGQGAQAIGSLASLFTPASATQAAGPLAAIFSDARLKENIERIDTRHDGLGVYRYNYIWSSDKHEGLMAQEVQSLYPEAIGQVGPYLTVDYTRVPHV